MARLPKQGKILVSDFPEQKSWIPKLLGPINGIIEDLTDALNKNLTFRENMAGEIITVTTDGTYPLDIKWPNRANPAAAWIGQCREVSGNHTTISTALYLDWEMSSNGAFRINNVAGLSASVTTPYKLTILAVVG